MSDGAKSSGTPKVLSSDDASNARIVESDTYDFAAESEIPASLRIPDDDDNEGLTNLLPRQSIDSVEGVVESVDDIMLYDREGDGNDFEILPDDEDEEVGHDDDLLEKVDEGSEGEHDDDDRPMHMAASPPTTPRSTHRRLFKLPMSAMSPTRSREKIYSPNIASGTQPREEKGKRRFLPHSVEKAFRAKIGKAGDSGDLSEHDETDGFSSEDSSYGANSTLGDDSQIFEDDADQIIDFSALSLLPNSFLDPPPSMYDYLDPDIVKDIEKQDISMFAWEHHLLSKGLMQLLAERDHIGVEDDIHDTSNILKMGPLKKRFKQKLWSVKYAEIRKGNLTYYDDKAMKEGKTSRTIVHLRKRTCRCETIPKTKDGGSGGYAFVLVDEGGPKRVWMAKSEEERQGWIKAINQAMIGETDGSLDAPLNMALYQKAIDDYMSIRTYLQGVLTRNDYMAAADSLLHRQSKSSALRLPMKWIREEVLEENEGFLEEKEEDKKREAPRQRVKSTVSDFWKILCSTSIVINGYQIEGNSVYSAERVIGALSRCILEHDKIDNEVSFMGSLRLVKRSDVDNFLTEVEAVSHARSILTGVLRSKSRNESLLVVENLIGNANVVSCIEMKTAEDLHLDVSFAGDDFSDEFENEPNDLSGWVLSRNKKNRSFKERYFVLSEGVLSLYLEASPRPFGLRGQFVLKDATVETMDENVIEIQIKDHHRQLLFEDRAEFLKWKSVIDPNTDANGQIASTAQISSPADLDTSDHKKKPLKGAMAKLQKEAKDTGERAYKVMKEARDAGMDKIRRILPKTGRFPNESRRRRPQRRRPTTDMLLTSTRALALASEKREPTVQVMVETNKVYQVIARDPQSPDEQEVMMIAKVKLFQAFLLSGGANGRLARGDEVFEMEFADGDSVDNPDPIFLEFPTSL